MDSENQKKKNVDFENLNIIWILKFKYNLDFENKFKMLENITIFIT